MSKSKKRESFKVRLSMAYIIVYSCYSVLVSGVMFAENFLVLNTISRVDRLFIGVGIAAALVVLKFLTQRFAKANKGLESYSFLMALTLGFSLLLLMCVYLGSAIPLMEMGETWFKMPLLVAVSVAEILAFFSGWTILKQSVK